MDDYLSHFAELAVLQNAAEPNHEALDERQVVLIILISSYLEAVINIYLAFAFDAEEIKGLDRRSVFNKWVKVPASRIPTYTVNAELSNELAKLIECRHALVHMQPEFSVEDRVVHSGNSAPLAAVTHATIMRWVKLPLDLVKNIEAQDKSDAGNSLGTTSDAWDASQGWEDRLMFYQKRYQEGRCEWRYSSL